MEIDAIKIYPDFQEDEEYKRHIGETTHEQLLSIIREKHQSNHSRPITVCAFQPSTWMGLVRQDVEVYGIEGRE